MYQPFHRIFTPVVIYRPNLQATKPSILIVPIFTLVKLSVFYILFEFWTDLTVTVARGYHCFTFSGHHSSQFETRKYSN